MATKTVQKLSTSTSQIGGLKTSRYEKLEVAYGVIPAASYTLGDTISFAGVRSKDIVDATIVVHTDSPVTLRVYPGTDLTSALPIATLTKADISYIINYVRGSGKVTLVEGGKTITSNSGDLLKVTVGSAAS